MDKLELGPIFRALTRNRTGAILIALQIAVTMTVVVNSWYMISERLALIERPSGLVESEIFTIHSTGFSNDFNAQNTIDEDLRQLRATPGLANAYATNAVPLSGSGWSTSLETQPESEEDNVNSAVYMADERTIETLGVHLLAGRNFSISDVTWRETASSAWPDTTILTATLATALFPELSVEQIIGKPIYASDDPMTVVGIVETLHAPWTGWSNLDHVMLIPQKPTAGTTIYTVRTAPGQRDQMMPATEAALAEASSERILRNLRSMDDIRERSYALDNGLANILIYIIIFLVLITSVGILGLASFSVGRRTKQIGTRRALGATQGDIMRYFMLENLMITGIGVVLGAVLTVTLNIFLVDALNFPKLHWLGVPLGMLVLLVLGQLAVYGPARRACAIPPAVATRTV